jgi:acetyltransferase-like isoleucine patch superfamily enzyme
MAGRSVRANGGGAASRDGDTLSVMSEPIIYPTVRLGQGSTFDPNTAIGYPTGRQIGERALLLGDGATVRSGTVIYEGSRIGAGLQTGHNVVIREENEIGDGVQVWSNSVIDYGCRIGDRVKIHSNCYVAQFTVLEDDCFLAPGVSIANDIHPGCAFSPECMRGPVLERGVQVGVGVVLLPYIRIGAGSIIGSGAVVTTDIPPNSVVVGNPGRVVRQRTELECSTGITLKPYPD